ncbi:MAG: MASE1 domain-containing protein, partial [Rhodospirillales bacterium]|nr:MASE1 domain-containing protein [Rhodospirillales bacterium]
MFTERKAVGIGPTEAKAGPRVVALRVTLFLVLFVCLDWISYWHPYAAFDITPWNPPPGVALFLLLRYGLGYLPVYWLAGFTSGLLIPTAPEPILAGLVAHGLVAVAYGVAALVLRAHLSEFRRPQEVFLLIGVSGLAALAAGTGALSVFCLAGYLSWPELPQVVVRFWIGDVIGIAVVTPFLMVRHRWGWPVLETQIQMAAVLLTVVAIFLIQPRETYKMFYLLFLPLLWVAVRGGFEAATRGVVLAQVALLVMLTISGKETSAVISYQFLMLA